MLHFLSPEALYGLLLVTTFASVGLLGLWAATSRWHPFLRTAIVLAILSVLLLRPMYEPFVMLVSQVATIALWVTVERRFQQFLDQLKVKRDGSAPESRPWYQFSLKTLMYVVTFVALGTTILIYLSNLDSDSMNSALAGARAGTGTFLTAIFCPRPKDRFQWFLLTLTPIMNAIPMVVASYECFYLTEVNPLEVFGYSNNLMLLAALCYAVLSTIVQLVIISRWMKQAHILTGSGTSKPTNTIAD